MMGGDDFFKFAIKTIVVVAAIACGSVYVVAKLFPPIVGPVTVKQITAKTTYIEADDSAVMVRLTSKGFDVEVWNGDREPVKPKPLGDKPNWIGGKAGDAP